MSTYNTLHTSLTCPRCGAVVETRVNCFFGYSGLFEDLEIGERDPWSKDKQPQDGGRPENGTVNGKGYMEECPRCHKDAFLRVMVRNDVIVGVKPDPDGEQAGYVPD